MSATRPPLVAVLAASAITLILIDRSGGPLAGGQGALRSVVRAAFAPADSAGEALFRPIAGFVTRFGRAGQITQTEAELARERERVRSEAARADALAAENGRLAALLGLAGPAGGDGVAARVVSLELKRSGGTLLLDRGGGAGLRPGMAVVAAGGLVGRIRDVGPRHSTVLPVTDPSSAVGVRTASAAGVAQGQGRPALRLDLLDPTVPLRSGDLAVTSGLRHSRFPAGLPVGRVAGAPGRFVVEPFAPPDRLEVVKVLRWEPEP